MQDWRVIVFPLDLRLRLRAGSVFEYWVDLLTLSTKNTACCPPPSCRALCPPRLILLRVQGQQFLANWSVLVISAFPSPGDSHSCNKPPLLRRMAETGWYTERLLCFLGDIISGRFSCLVFPDSPKVDLIQIILHLNELLGFTDASISIFRELDCRGHIRIRITPSHLPSVPHRQSCNPPVSTRRTTNFAKRTLGRPNYSGKYL